MTCTFKKENYPPIILNGTRLEAVGDHKHLGLILSSNLTWLSHINTSLNSVSAMCDMKKLNYDVDRHCLEIFFFFIRPKLECASHIWDNCTKQDSDKVEHFQRDFARIVTGARKGTSHDFIYKETNWLSLSEMRSLNCIKQLIKMSENHSPEYHKSILSDKSGKN